MLTGWTLVWKIRLHTANRQSGWGPGNFYLRHIFQLNLTTHDKSGMPFKFHLSIYQQKPRHGRREAPRTDAVGEKARDEGSGVLQLIELLGHVLWRKKSEGGISGGESYGSHRN